MFRLYKTDPYELLAKRENETEICQIIGNRLIKNPSERFMIVKRINKGDIAYQCIRSVEDYNKYKMWINNERIKNMSCMELKREILFNEEVNNGQSYKNRRKRI